MKLKIPTSYIKSITQYFGASLIPMVLNIAINPLIAMNMSPEDYAITGYYTSFNTLISPFVMFYMLHYYNKRYYELDENDREKLKSVIFKCLIFFSTAIALISFFLILFYLKIFNQESELPIFPYLILSIIVLPLTGIYTLLLTDYKMGRKSKSYFNLSVSNGIILVAMNVLFVVIIKWGAFGKLLAPLLTNIVFFIYSLWKCQDLWKYKFEVKEFKEILKFCFPLTIAAMLGFFSNGYDRIFLEKLGDVTSLGYYVVAVQMASYISVFQGAVSSTFQPDIFESIVKRNFKKTIKIIALIVGITTVIVLCFIVLCPYIIDILTAGRYIESTHFTQIIALSSITSAMYYSVSQVTIALGKTKITLINKTIGSALIVALFSILINNYQYEGACWGIVLSFVIFLLGNLILLLIPYRNGVKNIVTK